MRTYTSLLSKLLKSNRRLGSTRVFRDPLQHISATAFVHRRIDRHRRVSICAVLTTTDGLVVACRRRYSFVLRARGDALARAARAARNQARGRSRAPRRRAPARRRHVSGRRAAVRESPLACVLREVEEETGLRGDQVSVDERLFVHAFIDDLVSGRDFDAIIFTGAVALSSAEVAKQFRPNDEVKGLVFLHPEDAEGVGVMARLAAFARCAARLRCWGAAVTR